MPLRRRDLVRIGLAAPLGFAAARAATIVGTAITRVAPSLRPPAAGSSASRCALCGADDHAMLDPRCPAARRVI